jgi:phosphate transport system permease protein
MQSQLHRTTHTSGDREPRASLRTSRRRLRADRAAAWIVTGGGLAIIASVLGILLFILVEIVPLAGAATVEPRRRLPLAPPGARAVLTDEHLSHAAVLGEDGVLRVVSLASGEAILERSLLAGGEGPQGRLAVAPVPGRQLLLGATDDGRILAAPLEWEVSFRGDVRVVEPRVPEPVVFDLDPGRRPLGAFAARVGEDGAGLAVALRADGRLALVGREVSVNRITGERRERWTSAETEAPTGLSVLLLDDDRKNLYAGTTQGDLVWWRLGDPELAAPQVVDAGDSPITALSVLIGERSLVVGQADGSLAIWFAVRQEDETFRLTRIRDFPPRDGAVRLLAPSLRDKGFLAQTDRGSLGLFYSTSRRVLWEGPSPLPGAQALFYAPKGDAAILGRDDALALLEVDNPHPEISLGALFDRVWYEGYERPQYVWQSTGGTDDFEPKLSLTPLIVGTLKGTLYSLILAIPLGVLGAMYTSQFIHPRLRRYIKPTVEIMAALPSVVLGFLAGLWLAPRLDRALPALALAVVIAPTSVVLAGYAVRAMPRARRQRLGTGGETLLHMLVLTVTIGLCVAAAPRIEAGLFGGDFQAWLLEVSGLRYDQRNSIVVGLAMGFAVIPIIFSISEDAFSNVPRSLVSGSLALGASRWQTVSRVVLPTASPGIFSAVMIGFGRAIGETMIVLMATGNTPIMDWNPFNGFRTLSANIAVEIPEAPHGATLYRTLFLSALLLFLFTFAFNTVGDVVRQRLRRRYAEL